MCGIFGYYSPVGRANAESDMLQTMERNLQHRGPDASGFHEFSFGGLGNTRLAVIDLSNEANQPLLSTDGTLAVVQNGEIYNYLELKSQLQSLGYKFQTKSDTEVILNAYHAWGKNFVTKLNGMFAIAILDKSEDRLLIYRDRLGVKPLFYHQTDESSRFIFASEIKALLATGLTPKPDYNALASYLALNYISGSDTAFSDIKSLAPGHYLELKRGAPKKIEPYWELKSQSIYEFSDSHQFIEEFIPLFEDAIRLRVRSDVPVGAFLSGGLDSSSVVGTAYTQNIKRLKTYSIGFDHPKFDETPFANLVSSRFRTEHSMEYMAQLSEEQWRDFIYTAEQPFGDVSFVPMGQLSALARKDVTVALTGDGGDELFGGYTKLTDFFATCLTGDMKLNWQAAYAEHVGLFKHRELSEIVTGDLKRSVQDINPYHNFISELENAETNDPINSVLLGEVKTLLPNNNLVKSDRMSMKHSLELRSPFLDYRIAELAFNISGDEKIRNGESKRLVKLAFEKLLGNQLTYRKKQMFTVPVGEWFKTNLNYLCFDLLTTDKFKDRQLFRHDTVRRTIDDHMMGKINNTRKIRALISLELWFQHFIDKNPTTSSANNKK